MASNTIPESTRLRWYQFSLRTLMLAVTVVCILTAISTTIWRELTDPLRFNKRFHRAIASADRLTVIGFDYDFSDSDEPIEKTLFEVTDPQELAEVFEHLQLRPMVQRNLACAADTPKWIGVAARLRSLGR